MLKQINFFLKNVPNSKSIAVVDICCGDGKYLKYLSNTSIGLDYFRSPNLKLKKNQKFKKMKIGDDIKNLLIKENIKSHVFILSNTFEHVLDPHLFLLNIRRAMPADGILYLTIPITHSFLYKILKIFFPKFIYKKWKGFLQSDHVNFFTCDTLNLTLEYAGFRITKRYYGVNIPKFEFLSKLLTPTYGVICSKIDNWNYRNKPSVAKYLDKDEMLKFKKITEY